MLSRLLPALLLLPRVLLAQLNVGDEFSHLSDPCGLPDTNAASYRIAAMANWGYGFDSLQAGTVFHGMAKAPLEKPHPAGVYFARLQSGSQSQTIRMVLVR